MSFPAPTNRKSKKWIVYSPVFTKYDISKLFDFILILIYGNKFIVLNSLADIDDISSAMANFTIYGMPKELESARKKRKTSAEEDKENVEPKPWYHGVVIRPVCFRARKRNNSL